MSTKKSPEKSGDNLIPRSTFMLKDNGDIKEYLVQVKKIGGGRHIAIGRIVKHWETGKLIHVIYDKKNNQLIVKPYVKNGE